MNSLKWWMRIVGLFYLLLFVSAVFLKIPPQVYGPEGILEAAAAGELTAMIAVDTWIMFGLELGVVGAALIIASRIPNQARVLVWTVLAIELVRGIIDDIYMITRGYDLTGLIVWIVIHTVIIVTGLYALRKSNPGE